MVAEQRALEQGLLTSLVVSLQGGHAEVQADVSLAEVQAIQLLSIPFDFVAECRIK